MGEAFFFSEPSFRVDSIYKPDLQTSLMTSAGPGITESVAELRLHHHELFPSKGTSFSGAFTRPEKINQDGSSTELDCHNAGMFNYTREHN